MRDAKIMNVIRIAALIALFSFAVACNHKAAPEANASRSEETASEVKTASGGGPETSNRRSVPERAAGENADQGSAVPPAAADQTRPHPQQQPQQSTQQQPSTPSTPQR